MKRSNRKWHCPEEVVAELRQAAEAFAQGTPLGLTKRPNAMNAWLGSGTRSSTSLHKTASKLVSGTAMAVTSLTKSIREVSHRVCCNPSGWSPRAAVLAEVLRHIVQVHAVAAILQFAGTGIEQSCAGGQSRQNLLQPRLAVGFVGVSDEDSWFVRYVRSLHLASPTAPTPSGMPTEGYVFDSVCE